MLPQSTLDAAQSLLALLEVRRLTLATAESCTGGLIAAALTAIPGSSSVVACGYVTYSNAAKAAMLGIPMGVIEGYGAVSDSVARRMAEGALRASGTGIAVSCTGIAGPGGATATKPVGLVHFGLAVRGGATRHLGRRYGDLGRAAVREAAIGDALALLEGAVGL